MSRDILNRINNRLKIIWAESGSWPGFINAMSQTLSVNKPGRIQDRRSDHWVLLPGLCCQSAGGKPIWADDIASAWYLLYTAADLMDKIQDQDKPDDWWAKLGPGVAINSASGLFFTASLLLNNLSNNNHTQENASEVIEEFYLGFLNMCSGQHLDLMHTQPTLKHFWEIAGAKSGSFFSLACRCGARLATKEPARLAGYGKFGYHLGVLVQILDDLEEFKHLQIADSPERWLSISRSLPAIYAIEVYPPSMSECLRRCLKNAIEDQSAASEALDMINQSGAVLYIETEIERHSASALAGLGQASPLSPAGEKLASLLSAVLFSNKRDLIN